MVIFPLSYKGFKEMEPVIKTGKCSVWLGANVVSDDEVESVRELDVEVTVFNYEVDINDVQGVLQTISQHHPGETIWQEHQS